MARVCSYVCSRGFYVNLQAGCVSGGLTDWRVDWLDCVLLSRLVRKRCYGDVRNVIRAQDGGDCGNAARTFSLSSSSPRCLMSRYVARLHFFYSPSGEEGGGRVTRACFARVVARGGSCELKWLASSVSWLAGVCVRACACVDFSTSLFTHKRKTEIQIKWLWKTPRVVRSTHTFALKLRFVSDPF